ncbi:ribulose-phosphate 3-epimerase [Gleimia europaea]|uniref:Ribulose-phosphate 3-epimerase n=1 Tax=Gleimia europaea ACS-120-V-Col10b TaxID=883069 RepID=A0A9W5VW09_9ACTO|nr:ribulose-phosphate 3-epimerase [Gleimia europaea]EPD30471.1 ribulose-phosphate 3-epimerase [Gleimia europaea ACS-120-V-Col10b]
MKPTISPSILNCDIADLAGELHKIRNADFAHVDIMDNHFVPNLTWGLPVVEAVVAKDIMPVDCHLMIEGPDQWAPAYAEAGAASVTFHAEAAKAPLRLANEIHKQGAKVGLGLKPTTDIHDYVDLLPAFDMILVMTVEPGFGGQPFLHSQMKKIGRVREAAKQAGAEIAIQVDGGVNRETIQIAAEAGADVFVAGSAVFRAEDAYQEVEQLRRIASEAMHAH